MSDLSLAELERAVEAYYVTVERGIPSQPSVAHLLDTLGSLFSARRAAQAEGMVSVMVSREQLTTLNAAWWEWMESRPNGRDWGLARTALNLLGDVLHDLADVLKEPTP
jgi:hypothetical protein